MQTVTDLRRRRTGAARRAPRGDAGAATLEATGAWSLGALLVAALALVVVASAPGVGDSVRRAICIVVTLGQGDCGAPPSSSASRAPEEPCVLSATGHQAKANVAFVVEVGAGEQWLVEELSDGRFRVTRGTSDSVGAGVGVGLTGRLIVDDKPYGVALAAGAKAQATFRGGDTFYADDEGEIGRLLEGHRADVVKDRAAGTDGPIRWLIDKAGDVVDDDWRLPEPEERYVEGGVTLDADAKATWLVSGADAKIGITGVLGARIGKDGTTTEYLSATLDAKLGAGTWAGDGSAYEYDALEAGGSVSGVIEVERDEDGEVTAVRTKLVTAYETGATSTQAKTVDGPSAKGRTVRTMELPVASDADRKVALDYMRSLGLRDVSGLTVPSGPLFTDPVDAATSTLAYASAVDDRGTMTAQDFDDNGTKHGLEIGGKILGEVSGGGEIATTALRSTGARYWDGTSWNDWDGCA